MITLGLHGGITLRQHDASAALLMDGQIVALCEEERYTREKDSHGALPLLCVRACLEQSAIAWEQIDLLVCTGISYDSYTEHIRDFYRRKFGSCPKIELVHHETAHLACAFYASGWEDALCLSLDGRGDGLSGQYALANRRDGLQSKVDIPLANSIGLFYTVMTHYLGFSHMDEYKVMGLAPYGRPNVDLSDILGVGGEHGWQFDQRFVRDAPPPQSPFEPLFSPLLEQTLKAPSRVPNSELSEFYKNVAASTQRTFEEALLCFLERLKQQYPYVSRLCFAGGVALNCVANQRIAQSGLFEELYVPPTAGDRGLSLGCAYLGAVSCGDVPQALETAFLGSDYDANQIRTELDHNGIAYREIDDPPTFAARRIAEGRILGWHQGRAEAGARALGHRSILALPGPADLRERVNASIKFRESFRPFAPAVAEQQAGKYFNVPGGRSPYMTMACNAHAHSHEALGAVVHVDGTARVQTVSHADSPQFAQLLQELEQLTGHAIVLNTSFNLKGQPIVETPRDALMTFFGCGMDDLIIGNFHITKTK